MAAIQCKITELIKNVSGKSYSFEVTPQIQKNNLLRFMESDPLFYAITWHATLHKCQNLEISPLKLAIFLKQNNKNVLLHLSCHLLRKSFVDDLIIMLQNEGLRNLFVVLGENYVADVSDFKSTPELIRYIRQKTGGYFCIGVAAFPDRQDKFIHLVDKINSGADFIITQAFFDVETFSDFINKCKLSGITVPILPGIFPFETERELTGFLNLCKVHVTKQVLEDVKITSGYNVINKQIIDLSKRIKSKHFHFFTLDNVDRTLKFLK